MPEAVLNRLLQPDLQPLSARMAAAGSRRSELETVLAAAAVSAGWSDYADVVVVKNVTGKASAISRAKLLSQLRARYLLDPALVEFQAFRSSMSHGSNSSDRGLLCYLMMARCDRLFREVSLLVVSLRKSASSVLDIALFADGLATLLRSRSIEWSEETRATVQRHALSALKDFGIVEGSRTRRFVPTRPGPIVVQFAARLAELEGLTSRQTLSSRWFRLLWLNEEEVPDVLRQAHRAGALSFRMQAQVVELILPPLGAT